MKIMTTGNAACLSHPKRRRVLGSHRKNSHHLNREHHSEKVVVQSTETLHLRSQLLLLLRTAMFTIVVFAQALRNAGNDRRISYGIGTGRERIFGVTMRRVRRVREVAHVLG